MGSAGSCVPQFVRVLVAFILFAGCAAAGRTGETSGGQPDAGKATGAFAFSLYGSLKTTDGNLILSPSSISSVLAMAYEGAKRSTRTQMAQVLNFPLDRRQFHHQLSTGLVGAGSSSAQPGIRLSVANALWGQAGHVFLEGFLSDLKQYHCSELRVTDFSAQAETARREINLWAEEKTGGIIRDLITQGVITSDTRLVLTNAIHFKGLWSSPFARENTRPAPFFINPKKSLTVDMMDQTGDFRSLEADGAKVIEIPYAGKGHSMVVILPAEKGGLPDVESAFGPSTLETWMKDLFGRHPEQIHLRLPRFTMSAGFDLSGTLAGLGMPDAFDARADFSGMTGSRELFIGNVIHRASVEVDEEGSEAAAASAAVMTKSMPMTREFHADHPFIFLIRENQTGTVLFMGRVVDPRD